MSFCHSVYFIIHGSFHISAPRFAGFGEKGIWAILATSGLVFVSYAGLTKVASVAEEVRDPERNIPLGMMLSLGSTTLVYVAGVWVIVSVLDSAALEGDLTPVASAAAVVFDWLPSQVGVILIVIAALFAPVLRTVDPRIAGKREDILLAPSGAHWLRQPVYFFWSFPA